MQADDISTNVKMAEFGADSIIARCRPGALTVLTHCNTGSLATAGYGTALGECQWDYSSLRLRFSRLSKELSVVLNSICIFLTRYINNNCVIILDYQIRTKSNSVC